MNLSLIAFALVKLYSFVDYYPHSMKEQSYTTTESLDEVQIGNNSQGHSKTKPQSFPVVVLLKYLGTLKGVTLRYLM